MIHPAHHRHDADTTLAVRCAERFARFLGTPRFIITQTVFILVWVGLNVLAASARWDPYPFILLNLAFSTQAAYAAPLILLAQNRQAELDRARANEDHRDSQINLRLTKEIRDLVERGLGGRE